MRSRLIAFARKILQSLLASNAPSQLAAGLTLGMVIGLVPKGNLIAMSLCVLLFSLRVNKGLALLAAIVFSAAAPWTDVFTHKLGSTALGVDSLQSMYAAAYGLPLVPWMSLNNTVVAGSLLLSLYIAYPVYWTSRAIFTWLSPIVSPRFLCSASSPATGDFAKDPHSRVAA